ncbi:MAG: Spy/CpxP family protein refolding chaperone [Ignavibacteriales bacterium]
MTSPLIRTGLIAGAALSLVAATATFAQAPAPGAPQAPRAGWMHHQQHDPAQMAQRLRATLQLTPAQEPALQAFVTAMRPSGQMREQMQAQHGDWKNLTTPQRLDRMQAMMSQHQAQFAQHADAVRRFYAALTPAQQKAFDAMHQGMGFADHGKRGGHMWGGKDRDGHGPGMMAPPAPPSGQ